MKWLPWRKKTEALSTMAWDWVPYEDLDPYLPNEGQVRVDHLVKRKREVVQLLRDAVQAERERVGG